nr:putative ribonuclease h protein [Quercus suber]
MVDLLLHLPRGVQPDPEPNPSAETIRSSLRTGRPNTGDGSAAATVDNLIKEDTRTWNEDVIDGIFAPEEVALIKTILLSRYPAEDILHWPWTQTGKYTCKSGYRFLKCEVEESGVVETYVEDSKFLHSIWDLRVPNKIKNFMWQACCESIPTKANLRHRHITDNPLCERCLMEEDHVTCTMVMQQAQFSMDIFRMECLPEYKTHKLQGALILDTQQPWQFGVFCDDDVGHMAPAELGTASQTVLPIKPDRSPGEGEARRI